MKELVDHFSEHEQVDKGEEGRAYSTRDRCESVLNCWILPRWRKTAIDQIRTVAVEDWLGSIPRAKGTRSKIRNAMSAPYNHAMRWQCTVKNPITGRVRGSGVRQSAKRERIPDLLGVKEFQLLQAELRIRERILVWLDMTLGLRRGELAGLRWENIHFEELTVMAQRSIVDQVVGKVKTEASKRPIPIDPFIAEDLLLWYRTTKYNLPEDYVFATDAPRAGKKRGKQPVWLSKVMSYRIQPVAKRLGIAKRIGWDPLPRTDTQLLHVN